MSVQQLSASGPILCFKISGTLTRTEVSQMQSAAVDGIRLWRKVRALVVREDLRGWEKTSGWEDTSFADEHDPNIERMAIVGPEEWRDWVYAFAGRGFRPLAIEYFSPQQLARPGNGCQTPLRIHNEFGNHDSFESLQDGLTATGLQSFARNIESLEARPYQ